MISIYLRKNKKNAFIYRVLVLCSDKGEVRFGFTIIYAWNVFPPPPPHPGEPLFYHKYCSDNQLTGWVLVENIDEWMR